MLNIQQNVAVESQSREVFNKWVYQFGTITSTIILVLMMGFPILISTISGYWPIMSQLWPGFLTVMLMMVPFMPAETIGYMPFMGPGGLYMSFVAGNTTNLRMPVTLGTINALGIEPNTDECHAMAMVACGASVVTTITVVACGIFVALPLQPVLTSPLLKPAFDYLLPAIFGGLVAQTIMKDLKHILLFLVPLTVCLICTYFTSIGGPIIMLIGLACSVTVFLIDYRNGKKMSISQ